MSQRDFTNSGGQVSWTDSYFNFTGLTYLQAVLPDTDGAPIDIGSQATFGNSWTGQFYRTRLLYDDRGRQDETIEARKRDGYAFHGILTLRTAR